MEKLLTVAEVVELTKLKTPTVRKYVRLELIPFIRLGSAIRFRPSEIEAWIEARSHRPDDREKRQSVYNLSANQGVVKR